MQTEPIIITGDLSPNHWGICIGMADDMAPRIIETSSTPDKKKGNPEFGFRQKLDIHLGNLTSWINRFRYESKLADDNPIIFIIEDAFIGHASSAVEILKMHGALEYLFTGPKTSVRRFLKVSKATWAAVATEKKDKSDKINIASMMSLKYNYPVKTEHEGDALGIWTFWTGINAIIHDNTGILMGMKPNQITVASRYLINDLMDSNPKSIRPARKPKDAFELADGTIIRPAHFHDLFIADRYPDFTREIIHNFYR